MTSLIYPTDTQRASSISLADDLLEGADEIAEFMFGDKDKRRKVYYLAETNQIPVFRMGAGICARRSTILARIAEQERASTSGQEAA